MISRPDDSGFTMLEAAVALALLSAFGGLVATLASGGTRAIERAHEASAAASALLGSEAAIRGAASRVRIPYWERKASLRKTERGFSIPYYEGDPALRLELGRDEKSLYIATAGEARRFASVEALGIDPLVASTGELRGMAVALSIGGSRYLVAARFGQGALGLGKE